jgi:hypothetical protein
MEFALARRLSPAKKAADFSGIKFVTEEGALHMTKKLLGLFSLALFGSLTIHASTLIPCSPSGANSPQGPGQPTFTNVSFTCGGFTVTPGFFVSEEDWSVSDNTFNGGNPNSTQAVIFSYSVTGFTGPSALTDTVAGQATSTTGNGSACTALDNGLGYDCESTTPGNGTFTVTASSSWEFGSLLANGDDQVNLFYSYTLSPLVTTPEPASLLMIGGGLIGLGSLIRRKKKA